MKRRMYRAGVRTALIQGTISRILINTNCVECWSRKYQFAQKSCCNPATEQLKSSVEVCNIPVTYRF